MPARPRRQLNPVIKRLCAAADPVQPYARQLEQVAEAAVRYGLRTTPVRGSGEASAPGLRQKIETAVASFADPPTQAALCRASHQAGVPEISALAGIVLRHCHHDLTPLTTEQVARYAVEFAQALAEARPALAAQYRRWLRRCRSDLQNS